MDLPNGITLLPDGSVVLRDGTYLGTWHISKDDDAHFVFTPDGAVSGAIIDTTVGSLCERIKDWLQARTEQQ
jgi:hypothetical protein